MIPVDVKRELAPIVGKYIQMGAWSIGGRSGSMGTGTEWNWNEERRRQ